MKTLIPSSLVLTNCDQLVNYLLNHPNDVTSIDCCDGACTTGLVSCEPIKSAQLYGYEAHFGPDTEIDVNPNWLSDMFHEKNPLLCRTFYDK